MPRQLQLSQDNQRPDEQVPYRFIIPEASYPSAASPVATLYDVTGTATDVSATKLSGSAAIGAATIEGTVYPQVFTTPLAIALVAGKTYRLECKFVSGGGTYEPYFTIVGVE